MLAREPTALPRYPTAAQRSARCQPPNAPHSTLGWSIVAVFVTVCIGLVLRGLPRASRPVRGGRSVVVVLFTDWPREVATLAQVSTLAGNLLLVGSIANLIVVDLAKRNGIDIVWAAHARVGLSVTLLTVGINWPWLG